MMKRTFVLAHAQARANACHAIQSAPDSFVVTIRPQTRSLMQNSLLWPLLEDLSTQVDWYGQKLTSNEWKDVLTASLRKQKAVPGIDGGFVVLGERTSQYSKQEFSGLIELLFAFGAQHNVKFRCGNEAT